LFDLFQEALRLKRLSRTGWVRKGVPEPESVAAHSWGVSWLVVALLPPELDRGKALTYAVLHDLPEVRVGDLTPQDQVPDKHAREHLAARELAQGATWLAAWEAYERQDDPEAQFVKQLDRLDMALQAVFYAEEGAAGMEEFVRSASEGIAHPALRTVLEKCALQLGFSVQRSMIE